MTVTLTRYSTDTVLPAFAEGLSHLPNLHTLRICHARRQLTTVLKDEFEGKQYPQIRTVVLPTCAHYILRACPNVLDVTCNEDDGSQLLSAMRKVCTQVEVLEGFPFFSESTIARKLILQASVASWYAILIMAWIGLPKCVPKLRKLTLGGFTQVHALPAPASSPTSHVIS